MKTRRPHRLGGILLCVAGCLFSIPGWARINHEDPMYDSGYLTREDYNYKQYMAAITNGAANSKACFEDSAYFPAYWLNECCYDNPKLAVELLAKAEAVWPKDDEIQWCFYRTYHWTLHDEARAMASLQKAKTLFEANAEELREQHQYHYTLARRYVVIGDYEQALAECWKSVEAGEVENRARDLPDFQWGSAMDQNACELGTQIAIVTLRRPQEAVRLLEHALTVWPDCQELCKRLAWVYGSRSALRDYGHEQFYLEKSLELAYTMPDSACTYVWEGDPPKQRRLLKAKSPEADVSSVAMLSGMLATSYLEALDSGISDDIEGNVGKAQRVIIRALDSFARWTDDPASPEGRRIAKMPGRFRHDLVTVLPRVYGDYPAFSGHDPQKALVCAQEALQLDTIGYTKPYVGTSKGLVGAAYLALGQYRDAIDNLSGYLQYESFYSYPGSVLARGMLGDAYERLAHALSEGQSPPLPSNLESQVSSGSGGTNAAVRAAEVSALEWIDGAILKMETWRALAATDETKVTAPSRRWREIIDRGIRLNLARGDTDAAYRLIELSRARALLDLLTLSRTGARAEFLARSRAEREAMLTQLDGLQASIRREQDAGHPAQAAELQRSLVLTQDKTERLRECLDNAQRELKVTEARQALAPADVRTLLKSLDATLVEYWGTNYVAVVNAELTTILSLDRVPSRAEVETFRHAMQAGSGGRGLEPEAVGDARRVEKSVLIQCQDFYDRLLRPLESHLGTNLVILAPDLWLNFLPFQALHDGQRFLVETHALAYAPSASVLKLCQDRHKPAAGRLLAIGNPNLQEARYRLVHAEAEARTLAALFAESRVLAGSEATEQAVQLLGGDYDVLHVACHGAVDWDDPLRSCLRLAPDASNDGYLHLNEIFNLFLNAGLVTLSACDSGLGRATDGSEVLGLPRAFMFAGAPSVVASLWKVDDAATADLMVDFYAGLQAQSKAEALRAAQVAMIAEGREPFYWAAFCLYGDPQ